MHYRPVLKQFRLWGIVAALILTGHAAGPGLICSTGDDIPYEKYTCTYKKCGRLEIRADVYRYPGNEIRPAVIWIHGGALIFGTREWLSSEQLELYLGAGYAVVSIDYRLAPETRLPDIIADLVDACAWVRTRGPASFNIDAERIAVIGHSAGGYLTLMSGFRVHPPPRALVAFYGYGEITGSWTSRPDSFYNRSPAVTKDEAYAAVGDSMISSTPDGRFKFYLYCRQQGLWPMKVSGHDPQEDRGWFSAYEPVRNVTPAYPPTLLLHGEKDTDVPYEQSLLMAEALKRQGIDYEFISDPEWGHGFDGAGLKNAAVRDAFGRVLAFLNKHIQR